MGLALHVAAVMASRGMRPAEALRLVQQGLDEGRYLTAKTVENQLGSAYRKLGVRSRDGLGRVLAATQLT